VREQSGAHSEHPRRASTQALRGDGGILVPVEPRALRGVRARTEDSSSSSTSSSAAPGTHVDDDDDGDDDDDVVAPAAGSAGSVRVDGADSNTGTRSRADASDSDSSDEQVKSLPAVLPAVLTNAQKAGYVMVCASVCECSDVRVCLIYSAKLPHAVRVIAIADHVTTKPGMLAFRKDEAFTGACAPLVYVCAL
jgi:hypothetical protein